MHSRFLTILAAPLDVGGQEALRGLGGFGRASKKGALWVILSNPQRIFFM